jgi:hypothetical protein
MSDFEAILANIESNLDAAREQPFALLRIRSILRAGPRSRKSRACADWHLQDLRSITKKPR